MGALAAASLPIASAKPARQGVAFHYQAHFAPRQLDWYTRFEILVTGSILSPRQTAALKRGPKLVAYEWSSAYYQGDAVSAPLEWQRNVEKRGSRWLLTDRPLTGASAENGRLAQWYDFGSDELIYQRAAYLADRMVRAGYDGYFFDTIGEQCLPADVLAAFKKRYPGSDYNQRQGVFLKTLRSLLPAGKLIFLNQGYRHAEHLLPHADLDLSESYFTYSGERRGHGIPAVARCGSAVGIGQDANGEPDRACATQASSRTHGACELRGGRGRRCRPSQALFARVRAAVRTGGVHDSAR